MVVVAAVVAVAALALEFLKSQVAGKVAALGHRAAAAARAIGA